MAAGKTCRLATCAASYSTSALAKPPATKLRHLRIASSASTHDFPAYADVERLQNRLQRELLSWKAATGTPASRSSPTPAPPPPPTLISFTPKPAYTLGRRQTSPLSDAERERLLAPLTVSFSPTSTSSTTAKAFTPSIHQAPRGGLATYHGPGQVVFWPVLDLHSPLHGNFTVRDYACLLEKTTIAALGRFVPGLVGFTTENPGVWVRHGASLAAPTAPAPDIISKATAATAAATGGGGGAALEDRKISALGVHLRRYVTGLGVAVNLSMPVSGPESTNPWARIVACGLDDKKVTTIAAETSSTEGGDGGGGGDDAVADRLADIWADEFASRLGLAKEHGGPEGATVERIFVRNVAVDDDVD